MTIETTAGCTVITGEHTKLAMMLAQRGALKLETLGLRRRGRPASEVVREQIGSSTRNKTKLLAEFNAYIERVWDIKLPS